MSHDVFISHSSIDKSIADAVTAALEQSQIRCWIAPRDILAGESWGGSIISAIETSQVMVIVFSSHSNDSKQVMREVERAVQKDVVVVPFRVENVQPSRDMEYFLSATHWLDAVTPEMDQHLKGLVKTIQTLLNKSSGSPSPLPIQPPAPAAAAVPMPEKPRRKLPILSLTLGLLVIVAAGFWFLGGSAEQGTNAGKASSENSSPSKPVSEKIEQKQSGDIRLKAAEKVIAAELMEVDWSGDAAANDIIMIAKKDAQDRIYIERVVVSDKRPVEIRVPDAPGAFEVRFMDAASRGVIARRDLMVELPTVSLSSPDKLGAGMIMSVDWVAPNNKGDYLSIAGIGSEDKEYISYAYTARGSPTSVRLPDLAGDYELRYVSTKTDVVWARNRITGLANVVTLETPETALAGLELKIKWVGPANKGDYLSVAEAGSEGKNYVNYSRLKAGKTTALRMPETAGQYEVRYISGQTKLIWASKPIEISMPGVSISIAKSAVAGSEVELEWQGPANKSDYISVADTGSEAKQYHSYKYAKPGAKLSARMPDSAGNYVVRYISGQKRHIWAEAAINVTERSETLTCPKQVSASEKFTASWTAKGNQGDYLGVYKVGAEINNYESYASTRNKVKATLKAPAEAGDYELRYISGQQKLVWAATNFSVE
ncbi:MAG: hypothetical protein ACJAQ6_001132 [Arenicella sp.]|jgi:hypothetical protein